MIRRVNRKKKSSEGYIVPMPFTILVTLAAVLSLAYLWLGTRNEALGKEIKKLEARKKEAERKCLYEASRWASMKSPGEIEKALRRHNLEMTWPTRAQIVRLSASDALGALRRTAADGEGEAPLAERMAAK